MASVRRSDIDFVKGLMMIGVVTLHLGFTPNGFLSIDELFVISGFLLFPKFIDSVAEGTFRYCSWLWKRIKRLWSITVVVSGICLLVGYEFLIPDSYENLAESVVATNLFSENILSTQTIHNYWSPANEYKPLMQMWYIGVLMQICIVFPVVYIMVYKCLSPIGNRLARKMIPLIVLTVISLVWYILSDEPYGVKYYYPHFRFWEMGTGGVLGLIMMHKTFATSKNKTIISIVGIILICVLIFGRIRPLSEITDAMPQIYSSAEQTALSLIACLLISIVLLNPLQLPLPSVICFIGRMSLSVFVWSQAILAFFRLIVTEEMTLGWITLYIIILNAVSVASYRYLETLRLRSKASKMILLIVAIVLTATAYKIYRNAGVVRDVPELDIYVDSPYYNRNTEYIDYVYGMNRPFTTDKTHVLVIGVSYAREFVRILMEYDKENKLEISYSDWWIVEADRYKRADYIFVFLPEEEIPVDIKKLTNDNCKWIGVSNKYFGKDFNIYYSKRNESDYLTQTVEPPTAILEYNDMMKKSWGADRYVDMIEAVCGSDGRMPLFTPEGKIMSFDCLHLTPAGCKYYSGRIRFDRIFR